MASVPFDMVIGASCSHLCQVSLRTQRFPVTLYLHLTSRTRGLLKVVGLEVGTTLKGPRSSFVLACFCYRSSVYNESFLLHFITRLLAIEDFYLQNISRENLINPFSEKGVKP